MKKVILSLFAIAAFTAGTVALAQISGAGSVAAQTASNLAAIARLITGIAYVGGLGFAIGAIVKFKAHKDNPTQVTIGVPIALLFVGAALIFMPTIFKASGATMFASSGAAAQPSGVAYVSGIIKGGH